MAPDDTDDGNQPDSDTKGIGRGFGRRSVLLALGAGSSVGFASQYAGASSQEGDGDDGTETSTPDGESSQSQCEPCIDSFTGYLLAGEMKDEGAELENVDPVTTVELRVTDADVVFVDDGGERQSTATGTPDTGTTTGTPMGTPTGPGTPGMGTPGDGGAGGGIPDFYFDPVGISVQPGDTVEFLVGEQLHTVTAYHPRYFGFQRRIPEGVPGFTSPPVTVDDSWYYRFDEPGVYDLLCLPHEGLGMVMRVVVAEEGAEEAPESYPQPEPGEPGPSPIALRVLTASELDPQNVVEQGEVRWTDLSNVESEPPFGG